MKSKTLLLAAAAGFGAHWAAYRGMIPMVPGFKTVAPSGTDVTPEKMAQLNEHNARLAKEAADRARLAGVAAAIAVAVLWKG